MNPAAKVILDSVSPEGSRLTTMEVRFHRFVLAEFNTHRVFSRNSASSRAIPVAKQLEMVSEWPALPVKWAAEQPGMQGGSELEGQDRRDAVALFGDVHDVVTGMVDAYLERHPDKSTRLHKSLINRLLEPFMWHTVIVTATEWGNFFDQRCSPLAQPEIEAVALLMEEALAASTPQRLFYGEWHLPYVTGTIDALEDLDTKLALSAARCARVSYLNHDGVRDIDADVKLFKRLRDAEPPHFSPFEHQATPKVQCNRGNFDGWMQYRHCLEIDKEQGRI